MDMDEYQTKSRETVAESLKAIDTRAYLSYLALGLAGEAGEVAEKMKKMIRDDQSLPDKERTEALHLELGDVLWYLARLAETLDSSVSEIAEKNLEKLRSRADRNMIHGDGDSR